MPFQKSKIVAGFISLISFFSDIIQTGFTFLLPHISSSISPSSVTRSGRLCPSGVIRWLSHYHTQRQPSSPPTSSSSSLLFPPRLLLLFPPQTGIQLQGLNSSSLAGEVRRSLCVGVTLMPGSLSAPLCSLCLSLRGLRERLFLFIHNAPWQTAAQISSQRSLMPLWVKPFFPPAFLP